jgi:hypothetical protein
MRSSEEKDLKRQADAERKEQEAKRLEQAAFQVSPPGQARQAFERGDHLFQYDIDVRNSSAFVIAMGKGHTLTSVTDPIVILNAVCDEGWDLVNGSFVFHETGSTSRDKFLSSGQRTAVSGAVIGYYLFRRRDSGPAEVEASWQAAAFS